jgi:glucokinase
MLAIGVDIGGTKIAIGVVDDEGQILAQERVATDPQDTDAINRTIAGACNDFAMRYDVGAIGIAAAGFVSSDRSTMAFAPNIAWRDYPLGRRIAQLLDGDVPVVVENDANAAGWAEFRFGAGRGTTDMLMLTVGTGLGGAIILDRRLVRGRWGVAAEVGHLRVVPGGHQCGCGHEGCWEQYASGSALVKSARAAAIALPHKAHRLLELAGDDHRRIKGPHVTQAAQEGDPLAVSLFARLGRWLGEGAASVDALLDVEMIVIGGGVAAAGDLLLVPAREGYESALSALGHRPVATIELAEQGNTAGIVGAADLGRV